MKVRITLLNCLINENTLGIKHFVVDLRALVGGGVVAKDDCLISFMDLGFPENLQEKGRAIHEEYSREPVDRVPDVAGNRLDGCDNNYILLLAFEILCSKRQNEVHDRRVDTANHDVVLEFGEQTLFSYLHLSRRLCKPLISLVDVLFLVLGGLFFLAPVKT